jgi:hypothetical protein
MFCSINDMYIIWSLKQKTKTEDGTTRTSCQQTLMRSAF